MDASFDVIRRAYRAKMRSLHPDSAGSDGNGQTIAQLSTAWRVLGDPAQRATYDVQLEAEKLRQVTSSQQSHRAPVPDQPAPQAARSRREAWVFGVRAQIVHLSSRAGKSATQTLLLKGRRAVRAEYDELVEDLVGRIASDAEARVRAARAAGVAPLDLGVGATLIGVRAVADQLRRSVAGHGTEIDIMEAELLDRMWDVLAHELPVGLTASLGGNPGVSKVLRQAG